MIACHILDNIRVSEVAEHLLVCSVRVKSLELTHLHLCDGHACRSRRQLHTILNTIHFFFQKVKYKRDLFSLIFDCLR